MDKNLKRLARLQSVLDQYEKQLENLQALGEQINEDHGKIYFYVEHEDEVHRSRNQPPHPMFMPYPEQESYHKAPEFDPFYMEMKDHHALHFIGVLISGLKEQREILQEQIKHIKQEIINEN